MNNTRELTKTCRSKGAVGANAVVPKKVLTLLENDSRIKSILDFGAGKDMIHAKRLKSLGFNVDAHEIGDNKTENHIDFPRLRSYDLVYASNVLNIQTGSIEMFLLELNSYLKREGRIVINYPKTPRKQDISNVDMLWKLTEVFSSIQTIKYHGGFIFVGLTKN